MIKVVLVKPGKSAEALEIPDTLKAKQEIVGGRYRGGVSICRQGSYYL